MSERFFRSNRPGYPHPVSFELENGIRVAVGDCSVTERRRWRPPYPQNCTRVRKTLQTQRRRTHGAGCVQQWFRTAEPLGERRYENWNTYTHTFGNISLNFQSDFLTMFSQRLLNNRPVTCLTILIASDNVYRCF